MVDLVGMARRSHSMYRAKRWRAIRTTTGSLDELTLRDGHRRFRPSRCAERLRLVCHALLAYAPVNVPGSSRPPVTSIEKDDGVGPVYQAADARSRPSRVCRCFAGVGAAFDTGYDADRLRDDTIDTVECDRFARDRGSMKLTCSYDATGRVHGHGDHRTRTGRRDSRVQFHVFGAKRSRSTRRRLGSLLKWKLGRARGPVVHQRATAQSRLQL